MYFRPLAKMSIMIVRKRKEIARCTVQSSVLGNPNLKPLLLAVQGDNYISFDGLINLIFLEL